MDNMRLLSTYRVGKKRIFLYNGVSDKRIQGYHETKINKDNLYYKAFDYSSKAGSIATISIVTNGLLTVLVAIIMSLFIR